jgi:hypothetical protein
MLEISLHIWPCWTGMTRTTDVVMPRRPSIHRSVGLLRSAFAAMVQVPQHSSTYHNLHNHDDSKITNHVLEHREAIVVNSQQFRLQISIRN